VSHKDTWIHFSNLICIYDITHDYAFLQTHPSSCIIRDLTQQDGWKTQDGRMRKKMSRKNGNAQSRRTFYSAVLLCEFPIASSRPLWRRPPTNRKSMTFPYLKVQIKQLFLSLASTIFTLLKAFGRQLYTFCWTENLVKSSKVTLTLKSIFYESKNKFLFIHNVMWLINMS